MSSETRPQPSSHVLLPALFTLLLFAGLPLTDYVGHSPRNQMSIADVQTAVPSPPPPPAPPVRERRQTERMVPTPRLIEQHRRIPLSAALRLDMTPGDVSGDFAIDFHIAEPDFPAVAEDTIFELSELDSPPQPIARLNPMYPPRALMQRLEGEVHLDIVVNRDGTVRDAEVVRVSPEGVFEDVALRAVRRWRFSPGILDGEAVPARVRQTLYFSLER